MEKDYGNVIQYYIDNGYINLYFYNSITHESKPLREAFEIPVRIKNKNKYVNIYIRHKSEGYNMTSDESISHHASVKAVAVNHQGKQFGPMVPYRIPDKNTFTTCELIVKSPQNNNFDRTYGETVRLFVNHSADLLLEYWNCESTYDLQKIEDKIRKRYNRHIKNKSKK